MAANPYVQSNAVLLPLETIFTSLGWPHATPGQAAQVPLDANAAKPENITSSVRPVSVCGPELSRATVFRGHLDVRSMVRYAPGFGATCIIAPTSAGHKHCQHRLHQHATQLHIGAFHSFGSSNHHLLSTHMVHVLTSASTTGPLYSDSALPHTRTTLSTNLSARCCTQTHSLSRCRLLFQVRHHTPQHNINRLVGILQRLGHNLPPVAMVRLSHHASVRHLLGRFCCSILDLRPPHRQSGGLSSASSPPHATRPYHAASQQQHILMTEAHTAGAMLEQIQGPAESGQAQGSTSKW